MTATNKQWASKKVHWTTNPPCGCQKRWASSFITSVRCLDYVTCKNCLRIAEARHRKEHPAVSKAMDLFGVGFREYVAELPEETVTFTTSHTSDAWAGGVK